MNRAVAPAFALLAACFLARASAGCAVRPGPALPDPARLHRQHLPAAGRAARTAPRANGPRLEPPLQCPGGFAKSRSGASLLELPFEPLSWREAEAACEQRGAHLAVPDSTAEATELTTPPRWIGVTDRVVAGTYRTVTGAVAAFTYWDNNAARRHGDCAYVGGAASRWQTGPCDFPFPYTCEYDGRPAAPSAF